MASYKLRIIIITTKSAPTTIERKKKNAVNNWQREQDGREKSMFLW